MKAFQIALLIMICAVFCMAEPADNEPFILKQPDGSSFEARLVGDERFHVLETIDGYILQKDALGYYAYADETGNSSGIYARTPKNRSDSDIQFLAKLDPDAIYQKLLAEAPAEETLEYGIPKFTLPKIQRMPVPNKKLVFGDLRAAVILVQFSDVKFKNADPQKQFSDLLNKEGYNEYHHQGSARDYFIKNSMGAFTPTFDVYGPITISKTQAHYGGKSSSDRNYPGAREALNEALDTILRWNRIDFSQYDNDKDGIVDFIYMIYAGVGASSSGVIETIWPHAGYTTKKMGGGPTVRRYACSNEIGGRAYKADKSTTIINGIGTFTHEFSHVLGLPDLYDLKGANSRKTPHSWSIVGHGGYNCPTNDDNVQGCAPPFYSAFERMSVGWMASPIELNVKGSVQLEKIEDNVAYSVTNPKNPDEMFLLEYRTNKNWDIGQPSSGMLIWHIDYKDSIWKGQLVNNDGSHMYVDIEEAYPETSTSAAASDPFPGSKNVTSFNQFVFWNGDDMNISLTNIKESSDKEHITFDVDMTVKSSPSISSSSSAVSSSSIALSSSERPSSSSIAPRSSSIAQSSSSSNAKRSSSSKGLVFAAAGKSPYRTSVTSQDGMIHITIPVQGTKHIRIFSPNGQLLFETRMDGTYYQFPLSHQIGKQNVILSITQGKKALFMGMIRNKN